MRKGSFDNFLAEEFQKDPTLKKDVEELELSAEIASQIFNLRKLRGLTQEELAQKVGLRQPNIARWENPGYKGYTVSKLQDIARALNGKIQIDIGPKEDYKTVAYNVTQPKYLDMSLSSWDHSSSATQLNESITVLSIANWSQND